MRTKTILKIVAGIGALALIIIVLAIANSFVGNAISRINADNAIKEYINDKYSDLNLEVQKSVYNFKFGVYGAQAKSTVSKDTFFYVTYKNGKVEDDYETAVLGGWNTYMRVNEEYSNFVEDVIEKNMPYEFNILIADLYKAQGEHWGLELDKEYNVHDIPLDGSVSIYTYTDDFTWENVAKIALELDSVLQKNDLDVKSYSVNIKRNPVDGKEDYEILGVHDFPKELLSEENLSQVLKAHAAQLEQKEKNEKQ